MLKESRNNAFGSPLPRLCRYSMPKRTLGFVIVAAATIAAYVRNRYRQRASTHNVQDEDDHLADIIKRLYPAIEQARMASPILFERT
jgi:hypothetical protein